MAAKQNSFPVLLLSRVKREEALGTSFQLSRIGERIKFRGLGQNPRKYSGHAEKDYEIFTRITFPIIDFKMFKI